MKSKSKSAGVWLAFLALCCSQPAMPAEQLYSQIGLNPHAKLRNWESTEPVIVAVIDDAFLLTHGAFKGMLARNSNEVANNFIDDDANSFVDDVYGYDLSDSDSDITPPESLAKEFYHGTHSAGLISQIIKAKLGTLENYPIKLQLIKAVPNSTTNFRVETGYKGIEYAIDNGAHIISNSWSGGQLQSTDKEILASALQQSVFIVNTLGNYYQTEAIEPASHPAVFAVSGTDSTGVIPGTLNYGVETDLLGPASPILSASSENSSATRMSEGTSVAAPLVSATAALMRLVNPDIKSPQIAACLRNTAKPVDSVNPDIQGRLGAGLLQVDAAIECARNPLANFAQKTRFTPRGTVALDTVSYRQQRKLKKSAWHIRPAGEFGGVSLTNSVSGKPGDTKIKISASSAQDKNNEPEVLWSGKLKELPPSLVFDTSQLDIEIDNSKRKRFRFSSQYAVIPINFEKQFCSGVVSVEVAGIVSDGSGNKPYASSSNCQWFFPSKEGQQTTLDFIELDLHASDKLYLFAGSEPLQRNLLAYFSGQTIPKTINIKNGDALLWLVSDKAGVGQGFTIDVKWRSLN